MNNAIDTHRHKKKIILKADQQKDRDGEGKRQTENNASVT